jgi:hypothetical protein
MAEIDLKRTLDGASQDYLGFLEAQVESIAKVTLCIETAMTGKALPFV